MARVKEIVGLDIGSCDIKVVSCHLVSEVLTLKNFSVFKISPEKKLEAQILKDFYKDTGIAANDVATSIAGPSVVLRYLTLPKIKPAEIKAALKFELEKNIPFAIDDVITDGQIIKDIDKEKILVLAAAAKKEYVQLRLKLLQEAGLSINTIDIDALAVTNAFTFNTEQDLTKNTIALLNLGANASNLSIIKKGVPSFYRDISIGGANITRKIADTMALSLSDAENMKINPQDKHEQVNQIAESVLEDLISEVKFSFDYFESKENEPVNEIFLSGGSCKITILGRFIDEILAIPYSIWDPISKFKLDENINSDTIRVKSSQLAVAIGLIVRQLQ